jgi:integrase
MRELKLLADNPWESVTFAKVDRKLPESPDETVLVEFFQFVKARYPGWDLPILFLQIKCLIGCRLMDLCSARSNQLKNGVLELDPAQLKTRDFRRVELSKELYRALDKVKGETYLWECFGEQYRQLLKARGSWSRSSRVGYSPEALATFVMKLFRAFQKATGKKLRSHMLRRRAITLLYAEKVPVEVAARMLGMDAQTARMYYLDMDKVASGKKFSEFADKLIPPV